MKLLLFAIHDEAVNKYRTPFSAETEMEAKRSFSTLRLSEGTDVNLHPEQFNLYELGEIDTVTGKTVGHLTPKHVLKASSIPARPHVTQ